VKLTGIKCGRHLVARADQIVPTLIILASELLAPILSERKDRPVAAGVPFGESHEISARMMASIPPALIGRMMSGAEATQLLLRLVEGRRGRPEK
jgi:hypothetical protein